MLPDIVEFRLAYMEQDLATQWHFHPVWQFGCVTQGRMEVSFPEGDHAIAPDGFFLIASGHLHQIQSHAGSFQYYGLFNLTKQPEYFAATVAGLGLVEWLHGRSVVVREGGPLRDALDEMDRFWQRGDEPSRLVAHCLLVRMLSLLRERPAEFVTPRENLQSGSGEHLLLQQAMAIMAKLFRNYRLQVPDIAEACQVSRSTLDKLFRRRAGAGPKEYLQRYRVDRARNLLRATAWPVGMVAANTGFRDVYYFSRVFKRITGQSPTEYRNDPDHAPPLMPIAAR